MLDHYGSAHPLSRNPNGWFAVGLSHELSNGDVRAVSGGVMPQKSTDFYPKLLSGLTFYRF